MKTKYIINKNEMIVSLDCLYELADSPITLNNIRYYVNNIIVYKNGLLIGTFYLTNYYIKQISNNKRNNMLTEENSYFYETTITEMLPKKKIKTKSLYTYE